MLLGGVDAHFGGEAWADIELWDALVGLRRVRAHRGVTEWLEYVAVRLHANSQSVASMRSYRWRYGIVHLTTCEGAPGGPLAVARNSLDA